MITHWFAIRVKSRHEFKIADRFTEAGIKFFLPTVERLSRWKDRNKRVRFPLFPGYVFVSIAGNYHDRLAVLKIKGVVGFLGTDPGEPEPVPEDQIVSLKKVIESKVALDPYPYLQEGQRVKIKKGPLAGIEGMLIEKAGQHKLILSVDILCQSTSVTIQASEVEKL
ncbi:MAG: UpxY family transcription antiterminator [Nitrospirota bacterium]